ncbi:rCG55899 [Rattus norvegicus]|nr:rCG55899 [Rattus norvegicus]
MLEHSS